MTTINDRIQEIINLATNGNASMFARMCNVSASIINSIIGGRKSEPSFSILSKIYTVASKHGVSAHWLLTGEGEMTRKTENTNSNCLDLIMEKDKIIMEKDKMIMGLLKLL